MDGGIRRLLSNSLQITQAMMIQRLMNQTMDKNQAPNLNHQNQQRNQKRKVWQKQQLNLQRRNQIKRRTNRQKSEVLTPE